MHQCLLVIVHILIFWYVPITGNNMLFEIGPQCPKDKILSDAGSCRDFEMNGYLRVFYLIVIMYLYLSAL